MSQRLLSWVAASERLPIDSSISIVNLGTFLALHKVRKVNLDAKGPTGARKQSCTAKQNKKEKKTHFIGRIEFLLRKTEIIS